MKRHDRIKQSRIGALIPFINSLIELTADEKDFIVNRKEEYNSCLNDFLRSIENQTRFIRKKEAGEAK